VFLRRLNYRAWAKKRKQGFLAPTSLGPYREETEGMNREMRESSTVTPSSLS
jgi:hypothetical protein